jgi:hypothetical protein
MDERLVVWNARGLNRHARRTAIQELVQSERASFVCLQETKFDVLDGTLVKDMLGLEFDYFALPAVHTCGGILVAWDANCWSVSPYSRLPLPFGEGGSSCLSGCHLVSY